MEGQKFVRLPSDDGHSSHSLPTQDDDAPHSNSSPRFLSSSVPTQSSLTQHFVNERSALLPPAHINDSQQHQQHPRRFHHSHQQQLQRHPQSKVKVDIKALDFNLLRWTRSIRSKMQARRRRKLRSAMYGRKDIVASVFDTSRGAATVSVDNSNLRTLDHKPPLSEEQFNKIFESVCTAINNNVQPRMNAFGSSGSYFARDTNGQTVAIFKPKDEEPYGRLNPKYTKWFHRHFLAPFIGFGRACLIPNLSYQSEAAASVLDRLLHTHIVPRTQVVSLSSPSFFYDWMDRRAAKSKKKPFPPKQGSFQIFLKGYQDASEFLRQHPWPGRPPSDTFNRSPHRHGHRLSKFRRRCLLLCGKAEDFDSDDAASFLSPPHENEISISGDNSSREDASIPSSSSSSTPTPKRADSKSPQAEKFRWTSELMLDFREQLEKLIILDFLMRNTDRGLDNFMIRACKGNCDINRTVNNGKAPEGTTSISTSTVATITEEKPHIHVAAIDNSLAFPHQHPKGWRNYTYGWLWLPISLIGHPFSENTRKHFLPLLSSPQWWSQTTHELYKQFRTDRDFSPKMFRKQMAVLKGQGWNVVEALKHNDEGPLELCRRRKVLVWDDEIEVPLDFVAMRHSALGSTSPLSLDTAKQRHTNNNNTTDNNENDENINTDVIKNKPRRKRPGLSQSLTLAFPVAREPTRTESKRKDYMSMSLSTPKMDNVFRSSLPPGSTSSPSKGIIVLRRNNLGGLVSRPLSTSREVDLDNAKISGVTGIAMLEHMEGRQKEEGQDYEEFFFRGDGEDVGYIEEQQAHEEEGEEHEHEHEQEEYEQDAIASASTSKNIQRPKLPLKSHSNSSSMSKSIISVSSDYGPATDVYVRGGRQQREQKWKRWKSSRNKQWGWRAEATKDGRVVIVPYLVPSLFGPSFVDMGQNMNNSVTDDRNRRADVETVDGRGEAREQGNVNDENDDDRKSQQIDIGSVGSIGSEDEFYEDDGGDGLEEDEEIRSATCESVVTSEDERFLNDEDQTKIVVVERLEEIIANPTFTYC